MERRRILGLVGGAATVSLLRPLGVRAQTRAMPVIGVLSGTMHEPRQISAIQRGLSEAGYFEGRNVAFEYRSAKGRFERLPELAAELVRRPVALIVGMQSPTAPLAAKSVTSSVPIIFSIGGDPVKLGLVSSLSKPGGNVTGTTFLVNSLGAKRLELLSELVPHGSAVGVLVNPKNPSAQSELRDLRTAAQALRRKLDVRNASSESEIEEAFASFRRERVQAVTLAADAVFNARRGQIIGLAARHGLPAMYFLRDFADAGGLMSYGGSPDDAYRLAGVYAGRILKGAKPADLPVQQSTKLELVVNLETARAMRIAMPPTLLARADETIG